MIIPSRQSTSEGGAQQTVPISSIVDALEERELDGVRRLSRFEAVAEILDCDVRVTNRLAVAGEVLRRAVVGCGCVGEGAGGEVFHLYESTKIVKVWLTAMFSAGLGETMRAEIMLAVEGILPMTMVFVSCCF
jgi:hypothetical protein